MNLILRIFLSGFIILIAAIIINFLAGFIGLTTWYAFLSNINSGLVAALGKIKILTALFLFIIYPALLGIIAYYSFKFFNVLNKT